MNDNLSSDTYSLRTFGFVILGFIILAISIAIVSYWYWQSQTKDSQHTDKLIENNVTFVELQKVIFSSNKATFPAGGFVSPKYNSNIAAEVSGRVLYLSPKFAIGNLIKKGETLAIIDNSNYLAALASAKAKLEIAKSNYAQEQARSHQAASDAKKLNIKSNNLLLRKPQLAAAKASVEQAQAQLILAKNNLAKTTIKAPFTALIKNRNISLNESVRENTIIAQLIGTETFTVKLPLDTNLLNLVNIGDSVILKNSTMKTTYKAKITRLDPTINKNTRTVGAYVDISQPLTKEKQLFLNSYLLATITGRNIANTMWIDNNNIINNEFIWIKDNDDSLAKVTLTIFYRGTKKSLVKFNKNIKYFVTNPKDSFFVGEKVSYKIKKRQK